MVKLICNPYCFFKQFKSWRSGTTDNSLGDNKRMLAPLDVGIENLKNELVVNTIYKL